jgi:hypothetical protein
MRFDGVVAFAGRVLQRFQIEDMDFSAGVFDEAGGLKRMRDERDVGSP